MKSLTDNLGKSLSRRQALRNLGLGAAGLTALGGLTKTAWAGDGNEDVAILNFALNLEYLEAEFYTYAFFGDGIENHQVDTDGAGTEGTVTIKNNPKVPFADPQVERYAREIGRDERRHVRFFRQALIQAGAQQVARPQINLQGSFDTLAQAAGIGQSFDPFENDLNFLLGAFIFEDVGVTLFGGAASLLTNKQFLDSAAGILAVEAYHAGNIRVNLFETGSQEVYDAAQKISDLRMALSGANDDQGVIGPMGGSNIVPTDGNGRAFRRTPRQGLNIVYGAKNASQGLFFPNGLNGSLS